MLFWFDGQIMVQRCLRYVYDKVLLVTNVTVSASNFEYQSFQLVVLQGLASTQSFQVLVPQVLASTQPFQLLVLQILASTQTFQLLVLQVLASTQSFQLLVLQGLASTQVISAFGTAGIRLCTQSF